MAREPALLGWKSFVLLLIVALGIGGLYRFTDMRKKPMHTDEAILALKTQDYWRTGFFHYDKTDYHGPFLHHAAKAFGQIRGFSPDDMNERRFRMVVGIFGIAVILLPLFFLDAVGRTGAAMASLFIAASPMMNYFSRYYIMEIPFVFLGGLLLACLWRWTQSKNMIWLIIGGLSLGLMHATKETFVLNAGAIVFATLGVWITGNSFEKKATRYSFTSKRDLGRKRKSAIFAFVFSAVLASVWMFSNGFRDWQGVQDSVMTYQSYFERSGGSGHEKPWFYYLELIFWKKDGFLWTEAAVGGLAVLGMISVFSDRKLAAHERAAYVFLSLYTVSLLAVYSLIPYKTPWSVLGVYFSLALLAGIGTRWIFRMVTGPVSKGLIIAILTMSIYHLCHQTSRATDYAYPGETRYAVMERTPFAYAHTSQNLLEMVKFVEDIAGYHPDKDAMPIQVINSDQGWPLPWYWRALTKVGYQGQLPATLNAAVVVVDANLEPQARELLKASGAGEYESTLYRQRPGMALTVLVRKDLWNRYMKNKDEAEKQAESSAPPPAAETAPVPTPAVTAPEPEPASVPAPIDPPAQSPPSPEAESQPLPAPPVGTPIPVPVPAPDSPAESEPQSPVPAPSPPPAPAEQSEPSPTPTVVS